MVACDVEALESVHVRKHFGREELQIIVRYVQRAQVDVVVEVVLAECESIARKV